jgi:hypothetical protein
MPASATIEYSSVHIEYFWELRETDILSTKMAATRVWQRLNSKQKSRCLERQRLLITIW